MNMISDFDVTDQASAAGYGAMAPDTRTARDTDTTGDRSMLSDDHVVGDLHLVIYLYTASDQRVIHGASIDRGVGADLDIIAYLNTADLRHFFPMTVTLRQAETVCTDDYARMQQNAFTDLRARQHRHPRHQSAFGADTDTRTDHATRAQMHARPDLGARFNATERIDARAFMNSRRTVDGGTWVYPGLYLSARMQNLSSTRVAGIGIIADQRRHRASRSICGGNNHRPRTGAGEITAIPGTGEKAQLTGTGVLQSADAAYQRVPGAVQRRVDLLSQLRDRQLYAGVQTICRRLS